ncbi:MAG: hypothetical protein VKN33_11215 [Candidatus Sericytochromatia bacterium]|nr:hypothetical protein [Candidatus Sericytochromatia bacterium]
MPSWWPQAHPQAEARRSRVLLALSGRVLCQSFRPWQSHPPAKLAHDDRQELRTALGQTRFPGFFLNAEQAATAS